MVPVYYKGRLIARQRLDMIIDDRVIVECKAAERLPASAGAQLIGYLRATQAQVGVLLHFGRHPKFYRFVDAIKNQKRDDGSPAKADTLRDRIRAISVLMNSGPTRRACLEAADRESRKR